MVDGLTAQKGSETIAQQFLVLLGAKVRSASLQLTRYDDLTDLTWPGLINVTEGVKDTSKRPLKIW